MACELQKGRGDCNPGNAALRCFGIQMKQPGFTMDTLKLCQFNQPAIITYTLCCSSQKLKTYLSPREAWPEAAGEASPQVDVEVVGTAAARGFADSERPFSHKGSAESPTLPRHTLPSGDPVRNKRRKQLKKAPGPGRCVTIRPVMESPRAGTHQKESGTFL